MILNQYWKDVDNFEFIMDFGFFDNYYSHWKNAWINGCTGEYQRNSWHVPELKELWRDEIMPQLQRITLRTLVFEMKVCDQCGELKGATDKEKYQFFAKQCLGNPEYLIDLYKEYPLMYEDILRLLENTMYCVIELGHRFSMDIDELNQHFFLEDSCKKIISISGGNADSHNGGHSVYILSLDNGKKLVYKSRSMAIDEKYQHFSEWVFRGIGIEFWWNQILDRGEYGWSEWVEERDCSTRDQLERYYERNGVLLCISYLLGTGDVHYENLIAHGEYPVIVDLEMGVTTRGMYENKLKTPAEQIYEECVLHTGLLPLYAWNDKGEGVNVGAINGSGGQLVPIKVPVIVKAGTVDMHVEYCQPTIREGKNLALLNGKFIEPYEFIDHIVLGFEKAYTFFMVNKEKARDQLNIFQNIPVRHLIRDTQQYAMLLMASCHPNCMVSEKAREMIWKQVLYEGADEKEKWVSEQEQRSLRNGDIPYFWYLLGQKNLHSGKIAMKKDYFKDSTLSSVKRRLSNMGKSDMLQQKRLIQSSIRMGTKAAREEKSVENKNKNVTDMAQEKIVIHKSAVKIAEQIGDILLEEAIWSEDKQSVGWINITMAGYEEQGYLAQPTKMNLYDGIAGITVFMTLLAKETGKEKYRNIAEVLIENMFQYTEALKGGRIKGSQQTGAFVGESSIAYAYQILYSITGEKYLLSYIKQQCKEASKYISCDKNYDVLGGNAGAILVFLNAWEITGDDIYLNLACEAGDYLIHSAVIYDWGYGWINPVSKRALTGMAHGASGIMLALGKLGYYSGEEKYSEAAYQAYRFEQHYYHEEWEDWDDLRYDDKQHMKHNTMAWCHGWGGIATARLAVMEYSKGALRTELERWRNKYGSAMEYMEEKNFCLCHGKCGVIEILRYMGEFEMAQKWYTSMVMELEYSGGNLKNMFPLQECENYGLVGGMTGVGYVCLNKGNDDGLLIVKTKKEV
jgi:type 2 lantibiotic biosynthesis protein LanM